MRYPAIELGQPASASASANPACPDKFEPGQGPATLLCSNSHRLLLQVSKQAVMIQFGVMPQGKGAGFGSVVWQEPEPFLPMIASLAREFDAIRIRNYIAGQPAQVLAAVS